MKKKIIYIALILLIACVFSSPLWILKVLPHGELRAKVIHLLHSSDLDQMVNHMEEAGYTFYKWQYGGDLEGGFVGPVKPMEVLSEQLAPGLLAASRKVFVSELRARKLDVGWIILYGSVEKYNKEMNMSFVFGEEPRPELQCSREYVSKMPVGLDYKPGIHGGFCFENLSKGWYLRFTPSIF